MTLQDRRFIDAIKTSGIKNITLLDDAFDLPRLTEADYSKVYDFLDSEAAGVLLAEFGIDEDAIAAAKGQIESQTWTGEELHQILTELHQRFLVTRDVRFDPTSVFTTKASNNLADVDPLLKLLRRCGANVKVKLVGRMTGAPDLADAIPDLVFADFYLDENITSEIVPGEEMSEAAVRASLDRLDQLLGAAAAKKKHPSVILMSSMDVAAQAESYRRKASGENGKVFASRFGFIRKSDIQVGQLEAEAPKGKPEPITVARPAADVLLDIIQSHPFGHKLHEALLFWLESSQSAVDEMKKEIDQLELKDFAYLVTYRLAQEGMSLFDYLEWFFGECLLGSIGHAAADKFRRPSRDKLDLHAELIEGAYDGRTRKIAELYHRARIDTKPQPEVMRMGDLYVQRDIAGQPAVIWALMTPDCDLVERDGGRAAENLLTVGGNLLPYHAPKSSLADFIIVGDQQYSIDWQLKNLQTRTDFENLEFCGSLRPLYAQDLQRQVLEELGRVGVAVAPVVRMDGRIKLSVRRSDGKLHEIDLGGGRMCACEVYPSRGGSDTTRINLHRSAAENVVAKIDAIEPESLSAEDKVMLKALRKRATLDQVRSSLSRGAKLDVDLGAQFIVTDKMTATKTWLGISVEMIHEA
ncbi:hypothetical protein [Ciceribacter selenitireducens]|uniref:Uncharacterized protein n=1 Tax=Ciceribacter selenitireducens ATCC BAA-1503 TaxID=1336235 RepID=A0A376AAE7_9HYPH|nr:hypothetical protein [Ciceribacter selenitireducens]SSC64728.1 unnamed protein product [Ciceribacter selenitireducens ATCC BAA-1503]